MFGFENDEASSMLVLGALVVAAVFGIAINSFLLHVGKKLLEKSMSIKMIYIIGVADLLLCGVTLLLCSLRPVLGFPEAYHSKLYCPVLSSGVFFSSSMSGILMGFLAMERYSVICHRESLSPNIVWPLLGVVSLTFAVFLAGNSINGGFAPDPTFIFCMPKGTEWSLCANYAFNLLLNIPILVLTFCYISIFAKCYRANVPDQDKKATKRAALRSLLFLCVYFICYIPKVSTTVIGLFYGLDAPPRVLYMLAPICMTLLAIINPILVFMMHRQIKDAARSAILPKHATSLLLE
ncbi:hypothetical protein DSO57_1005773 [Entomophthora muscae]|uniref:Uncharacterized protein n=1 Tax=Entomophthora muscae TaxID=34485 RepID=A0ACC2SWZ6_9FUNG|nr:hypothetical protein DSO57_1005773 [Entomophthora muscae]